MTSRVPTAGKTNESNTDPPTEGPQDKIDLKERKNGYKINWYQGTHISLEWCEERWKERMDADYWVYSIEKCPTTGRLHIEGYAWWHNKKCKSALMKQLPGAKIEAARSEVACMFYCQKERSHIRGPYEFGRRPAQGEGNEWKQVVMEYTKDPLNFAINHPMAVVKYHRGLAALAQLTRRPRKEAPRIYHMNSMDEVNDGWAQEDIYVKDLTPWWDGYAQQKVVVLRSTEPSCVDFEALCASYHYWVPVKRESNIPFNSPIIIVLPQRKKKR